MLPHPYEDQQLIDEQIGAEPQLQQQGEEAVVETGFETTGFVDAAAATAAPAVAATTGWDGPQAPTAGADEW